MKAASALILLQLIIAGCSSAYLSHQVPFPYSDQVATYSLAQLKSDVAEQDEFWKHPPAKNVLRFKRFPSVAEFQKLAAHFREGDTVVEFKNRDWSVGIDHMSSAPERAFCVMRDGHIAFTLKVWPTEYPK